MTNRPHEHRCARQRLLKPACHCQLLASAATCAGAPAESHSAQTASTAATQLSSSLLALLETDKSALQLPNNAACSSQLCSHLAFPINWPTIATTCDRGHTTYTRVRIQARCNMHASLLQPVHQHGRDISARDICCLDGLSVTRLFTCKAARSWHSLPANAL